MIPRVVELASTGQFAHAERGFLVVERDGKEQGRIPLEDVGVLLVSTAHSSISSTLLTRLAEAGAITVVCGENFRPAGLLWPTANHSFHQKRLASQIAASKPFKKQLWRTIVVRKILNQIDVLREFSADIGPLSKFAKEVKSGDPTNREALAARHYWCQLFEKDFRRDINGQGINAMLNYGYAVLRAAIARATSASGLHPAFGFHHSNLENPFCLVDDLIEPFRPFVDLLVKRLVLSGADVLDTHAKRLLAGILQLDTDIDGCCSPISEASKTTMISVVKSLDTRKVELILPSIRLEVDDNLRMTA